MVFGVISGVPVRRKWCEPEGAGYGYYWGLAEQDASIQSDFLGMWSHLCDEYDLLAYPKPKRQDVQPHSKGYCGQHCARTARRNSGFSDELGKRNVGRRTTKQWDKKYGCSPKLIRWAQCTNADWQIFSLTFFSVLIFIPCAARPRGARVLTFYPTRTPFPFR